MRHLDEGTIQALLDGELTDGALEHATTHLGNCARCINALAAAENAVTEFNQVFAVESPLIVPSQRIWARIENELDVLAVSQKATVALPRRTESAWTWKNLFASQNIWGGALAAFLIGVALVILTSRQEPASVATSETPVAALETKLAVQPTNKTLSLPQIDRAENALPATTVAGNDSPAKFITERPRRERLATAQRVGFKVDPAKADQPTRTLAKAAIVNRGRTAAGNRTNAPLPEEAGYLRAIETLEQVTADKSQAMRPSAQVDYQQSLAATESAINAMQRAARRNPRDQNAQQILFAAYQEKIDLLSTVSEKSQLVASVR